MYSQIQIINIESYVHQMQMQLLGWGGICKGGENERLRPIPTPKKKKMVGTGRSRLPIELITKKALLRSSASEHTTHGTVAVVENLEK